MIALVVGVPAMMGVGIILPFAGLFSLYKSWLTSTRLHIEAGRTSLLGILVSQLAGGILSILVIPLLHLVLREGSLLTITSALLLIFGLLMPIAFWLAVWYYPGAGYRPSLGGRIEARTESPVPKPGIRNAGWRCCVRMLDKIRSRGLRTRT